MLEISSRFGSLKDLYFANMIDSELNFDLYVGVLFLQTLRALSCDYKMENETRMVICDLGNPMAAGTNVRQHQKHLLIFIKLNCLGG